MNEHFSAKPFVCYKIDLNIIIIESFHTDAERKTFLENNKEFKPIGSVLIKGVPNGAA